MKLIKSYETILFCKVVLLSERLEGFDGLNDMTMWFVLFLHILPRFEISWRLEIVLIDHSTHRDKFIKS